MKPGGLFCVCAMKWPLLCSMFGVGRYSIPRPVTRNLEDLDSVQSVLLHRLVERGGELQGQIRGLTDPALPTRHSIQTAGDWGRSVYFECK